MKIELKIRIDIDDSFEKKMFDGSKGMFTVDFRSKILSYLGHLMEVTVEEKASIDSFIIKRLPTDDCEPDPDIEKDVTGQAI
jgi:hypothetical protein